MSGVFGGYQIGFYQDTDICSVKLVIDNGAIADKPSEAQISFD